MNEARDGQRQCEEFVRDMLRRVGAVVTEKDSVWSVRLAPAAAAQLSVRPEFKYTCHMGAKAPHVEYITPEHPLVHGLIQRARQEGPYFNLMLAGVAVQSRIHHVLSTNCWINKDANGSEAPFRFENIRVRPTEKRLLYQRQYWFRFAVAYVADVREEQFVDVWLDAHTETVAKPRVWHDAVGIMLPRRSAPSTYVYNRLYDHACRQLQKAIGQQITKWHRGGSERLADEMRRIDAYYRDVAAEAALPLHELLRMRSSMQPAASGRDMHWDEFAAAEKTIRSQLDGLELQRQRHLHEAKRRYEGRAEARLVSVVCLHVPRVEWTLRLACKARPTIVVCYDVADGVVVEPRCEQCDSALKSIYVDRGGAISCVRCTGS